MARILAVLILPVLFVIAGCAAPAPEPAHTTKAEPGVAPQSAVAAAQSVRPETPKAAEPGRPPLRTGGPLPPERVGERKPDPNLKPVEIDMRCRTNADCTVKNVGNCCGYYPACVNVDSPTDPAGVQAGCAKDGMASVCGWQEITSCSCVQGRCEGSSAGAAVQ